MDFLLNAVDLLATRTGLDSKRANEIRLHNLLHADSLNESRVRHSVDTLGTNINSLSQDGRHLLHHDTVRAGMLKYPALKLAIELNADVNAAYQPIEREGRRELFRRYWPYRGCTPLMFAASAAATDNSGQGVKIVKLLLEAKADPQLTSTCERRYSPWETLLIRWWPSAASHTRELFDLLAPAVASEVKTRHGARDSSLMTLVQRSWPVCQEMLQCLLDHIDPGQQTRLYVNLQNETGFTALFYGVIYANLLEEDGFLLRTLLAAGVDLCVKDRYGSTAAQLAHGRVALMKTHLRAKMARIAYALATLEVQLYGQHSVWKLCGRCHTTLPHDVFSFTQYRKPHGRCRACITDAVGAKFSPTQQSHQAQYQAFIASFLAAAHSAAPVS